MKKEKIIAIITGPSAVGKTTIAKRVLKSLVTFKPSTTYTTRLKRKAASEDKIMYYVDKNKFRELIDQGEFAEWANFYGNFYGSSLSALQKTLKTHNVLMNIDVEGAKIIKRKFPKNISIFILPDNEKNLFERLAARNITRKDRKIRLERSKKEIAQANKFDYQIINYNDKPEIAINKIIKILEKY